MILGQGVAAMVPIQIRAGRDRNSRESVQVGGMRKMTKEELFFECLNSFEGVDKPAQVITKCRRAIQMGLNFVEEAIVHGLLMHTYAKQRDLEKAQEELLCARQAIGKIIGLSSQELQRFVLGQESNEQHVAYRHILEHRIEFEENIAKGGMLEDLMTQPTSLVLGDLGEKEERDAALEWLSSFPDVSALYLLLGDIWATRNIDYAIKCLKIVERRESHTPDEPPTIAELVCRYKLGKLYRQKGDITSAAKEFKKVSSASSHPHWHILQEEEKGIGDHWIAKAKRDLVDTEQQLPKGRFLDRFRRWPK